MVAALSPSRASDFMQCPLLYRFRVIDKLPQAPSAAAARGTLVHSVLERVFDLPAAGRTLDAAAAMVAPQWAALLEAEPELAALVDNDDPEALALWVKDAVALVERWFSLEDPTRLEPAERELYVETDLDGLILRGYVDRLDVAPTGEIRVVDYKTGRSPSELFEGKALFQMKFYALVLWRLHGTVPRMLQLVYLGNSEIVRYYPGRGRPAGHRAQAQGVVAGHRARGHHRRLAPPHQPAVRLVRPPGPLPGLGRHSPRASRGRRAPRPQPARFSCRRPQRGLTRWTAALGRWQRLPGRDASSAARAPGSVLRRGVVARPRRSPIAFSALRRCPPVLRRGPVRFEQPPRRSTSARLRPSDSCLPHHAAHRSSRPASCATVFPCDEQNETCGRPS